MVNEQTQKLAERIASLLQENEKGSDDFAFVRASLEKINERLDKIESQVSLQNLNPQPAAGFALTHPSHERFLNLEEASDVSLNSLQNEKACTFEPNGKPCDHCSMCNSRGF